MKGKIAAVLAACVLVTSIALAQGVAPAKDAAQPSGAPDRALVQRILDAWSTLDPDNVKQYYDQGPTNVFYDVAPLKFVSFAAYAEGLKPMYATLSSLKFTLNDDLAIHPEGNLAWATVTLKAAMTEKAGKVTNLDGRWTVVWQKKGGAWVIVHDHFSTPMPQ